jgi:signal transduction histidine kinase
MLARYPDTVWRPTATALTLIAVTTPAVIYIAASPPRSWAELDTIGQLVVAPVCLVAALLVYFAFRMSELPALAWLVLGMVVYAIEGVTIGLMRAGEPGYLERPDWMLVDLVIAAAVAALALFARDRELRFDPLGAGIIVGALIALTHVQLETNGPVDAPDLPAAAIGVVVLALWWCAAFRLVWCAVVLPRWMTQRVALAFVLLTTGRVGVTQDLPGGALNVLAIVALVSGAVLLLSSTTAALRYEIARQRHRIEELDVRMAVLEARAMEQRSRLHEIANSVASIAGASKIIHERVHLTEQTRARFEEMLDTESARLARILEHDARPVTPLPPRLLLLDDLIRPLVAAQEVMGRRIKWAPSGLTAFGDADGVTEALNVLLDNARKHAPGGTTIVHVRRAAESVEIVVADDGPGIAPDARERSFAAGHRGPTSHGQGLGLHLAQIRLRDSDGSLALVPSDCGSVFVATLRAGPVCDAASAEVRDAS